MERYIAQKAGEALEAMCGKESLTERLNNAKMYFGTVSGDGFLSIAPKNVRESITAFMKSDTEKGSLESAALVTTAISLTLFEFGRQDNARPS